MNTPILRATMLHRGWAWRLELPNSGGTFTRLTDEYGTAQRAQAAGRASGVAGWRIAITESAPAAQDRELAPC